MHSERELRFRRDNFKGSDLRRIWNAYKTSRLIGRIRTVIRYLTCPFRPVIDAIPKTASILDVGCGDGLLVTLLAARSGRAERLVLGIDPAAEKIENCKSLDVKGIQFACAEISTITSESFDCITVIDVMYLLPLEQWADFLHHCVRILTPNGLLLIKEVHDRPRWKARFTYAQELFSIYASRMTRGNHPHFESIATYRQYLQSTGAVVEYVQQLDSGLPYPHFFLCAKKH